MPRVSPSLTSGHRSRGRVRCNGLQREAPDDSLEGSARLLPGDYSGSHPRGYVGARGAAAGCLRWIQKSIPPAERWFPVFGRYVGIVADRVKALGGNPDTILRSPGDGRDRRSDEKGEERVLFVGKVCALAYDRFGDFEGFTLDTEDGERSFHGREPAMERVVRQAWEERIRVKVGVERHNVHRPETVILVKA
jgi:hypothetical protein